MQPVFDRSFFLTPGLCNARRELPVPQLVSQIIETATEHANLLGIGFKYMTPQKIGWVLSRLTLEMKRYPGFNEEYTLRTWVEDWNRHFSVRCFAILDHSGAEIGYARTVWMVIDLETHSNVGTERLPFSRDLISADLNCPILRQKRYSRSEPDRTAHYTFRYTDIDFYGHVNTVRYVELLLNQFPLERYDAYCVGRLEMAFQHEARFDENVAIAIKTDSVEPDSVYKIIENMEIVREGQSLLTARLCFRTPQK